MNNYAIQVIEELRFDINNEIRDINGKIEGLYTCFYIALGFILIQFGIIALLLFKHLDLW